MGFRIELEHIHGIERGWKETKGGVVFCDGLWAVEVVDKLVDELFFIAGGGDAEIFNSYKGAFLRKDKADKRENSHGFPDI